jgi:syntaxin 1B/2/3
MAQYSQYGMNPYGNLGNQQTPQSAVLSSSDFLSRVEGVKKDIERLTSDISQITSLHQRAIASSDSTPSNILENVVTQTQILATKIKDGIRYLKTDALRSGNNSIKDSQIRSVQTQFTAVLEQYQQEEVIYRKRYQEQIARQYRIIYPEASEDEVREAMQADWQNEGVFQTAVSTLDRHITKPTIAYIC